MSDTENKTIAGLREFAEDLERGDLDKYRMNSLPVCDGRIEGYVFSYFHEGTEKVRVCETYEADISEMIDAFESFLRAAGFGFRGRIELIEDDA